MRRNHRQTTVGFGLEFPASHREIAEERCVFFGEIRRAMKALEESC